MSTEKRLRNILIAVIIALVIALPFALKYARYLRARTAVVRYTVALDEALSRLSPKALGTTAIGREPGRVESYIGLLYQRGVYLESDLLEMKILSVESRNPTVTATVYEKWRYIERDRKSGKQVSKPSYDENHLRYTLLPGQDGKLAVYLSEIIEDSSVKKSGWSQ